MKLPKSFYSWSTVIGAVIASISFILIIFMFLISYFTGIGGNYSGLITYIILPGFMVIGLIMIPIGIFTKMARDKKGEIVREYKFPVVDLNEPSQRKILFYFLTITGILLLLTAYGSYEAYHFTESTEFCGKLCHRVMEPEYTAYQSSAHARVACVECHVGTGASWYVKSKMSGLRQVAAVIFNTYPRPIPTPIENLRPARETCEECHWPQKFYPRKLVVNKHFLPDEENTEWDIALLMKVGPVHNTNDYTEGIHWHINPNVKVEYIATDSVREVIPWVRYINLITGDTTVFTNSEYKIPNADSSEIRSMDCLDCHNRPSHNFPSPMTFMNRALTLDTLMRKVPDLKSLSMQILNTKYPDTDSAMAAISSQVDEYYKSTYEEFYKSQKNMVDSAVTLLRREYNKHIFPTMKVSWEKYPNHIGHLEFNGCFRCHDGNHTSSAGKTISMDCNLCHSIVAQGVPDTLKSVPVFNEMEFIHPNDPDGMWREAKCSECHKELY